MKASLLHRVNKWAFSNLLLAIMILFNLGNNSSVQPARE